MMDILKNIEYQDSDNSKLIEDNLKIFNKLAENMRKNDTFRYFFLTGLEELSRGETVPISESSIKKGFE